MSSVRPPIKKHMLSAKELEEIWSRCSAATPRPWRSFLEGRDHSSGSSFIRTALEDIELRGGTALDQDFIAGARQDVPALVTEVRRLTLLHHVDLYRRAVLEALSVAPADEYSLYTLHQQQLERLSAMVDLPSAHSAIVALIASERQAFGRSFLSGAHGSLVESAFHALAKFIEIQAAGPGNGA